ncbi:hypothetical protein M569_08605 [Genlisea aurea]|uniref:SET domain-containing protein n=1 Tax=Genlisea aurea TaxID=192259 RepID=S8DSL8_9LAMI|nr:hypothetical protein M569_08605 [Genlisea aurea]
MEMSDGNELIRIVNIENKGRAIVSSRDLKAGEVILKESPLLLYSAIPLDAAAAAANYCAHCFRIISHKAVPCPNCSPPSLFCSSKCQSQSSSSSHTAFVCQSLAHLRSPDSPLRRHDQDRHIQAWFLISAYNLALISPPHFQILLSLQGEPTIDETSLLLHSITSDACRRHSPIPPPSVELTAALLAKDKLNAFGLMEPLDEDRERSVRAYGIYPKASFFNHDCLPNACRFDYVDSAANGNTDIVVRVIHDLAGGREVCLSYFPVNVKYSERQARLMDDYGFICDCDRCRVEASWSDDETMEEDHDSMEEGTCDDDDFPHSYFFVKYMCSGENCGGTLAPLPPGSSSDNNNNTKTMECNVCGRLEVDEEDN